MNTRERPASAAGFHRLAVVTLVTILGLVALGGVVRAKDAGLACGPEWPGCFGTMWPGRDPYMWLEHGHRLLAGVVGLLTATLAIWVLRRFRGRRDLLWPALAAVALVVFQSFLGALVVWNLLRADLVTAHLGMAMLVVAALLMLAVNAVLPRDGRRQGARVGLARTSAAVAGVVYVQILVGGHVTGIGAGRAFLGEFPTMGGRLLPRVTNEAELFHLAHRLLGFVVLLAAVLLVWRTLHARRAGRLAGRGAERWLLRLPWLVLTLVVVQAALGVANLFNDLSWVTVIPHLAVASWIWAAVVLNTLLAYRPEPAPRMAGMERELLVEEVGA